MRSFNFLISLMFLARTYAMSDHYPNGTKVFYFDNGYGEWINGKILKFDNSTGLYTLQWEGGRTETSEKFSEPQLYNMVENYETLWPIGTALYNSVNETFGSVTGLTQFGAYTITWDNGDTDVDKYSLDLVDQMVKDYMVHGEDVRLVPMGTHVYLYDEDDKEWDLGKVTKWTSTQGYTIIWGDNVTEVGLYTDQAIHDMVNNYRSKNAIEADAPIPEGTGVYQYNAEEQAWFQGTIIKQSPQLGYTIMWENSAIEVAQYSLDEVRQMVLNFMNRDQIDPNTRIIPIGSKVEQDGTSSSKGIVKKWTPTDGYTVHWDDGAVDTATYTHMQIDSMMRAYATNNTDHWPVGTRLYQQHDGGWREGVVSGWNSQTSYIITWDDGTVENNAYTHVQINEMVKNSHLYNSEDSPYMGNSIQIGTPVFLNYDDEWYEGTITAYDQNEGYTITWEDGNKETNLYTKEELEKMIDNWRTKRPPSRSGNPWLSPSEDNPLHGLFVFFLLMAFVGPLLILFRKWILVRGDEREIMEGDESVIFPDPNALPSGKELAFA